MVGEYLNTLLPTKATRSDAMAVPSQITLQCPLVRLSRYFESSVGGVKGIDTKLHHKAQFYARQFLNALSPISR